MRKGLYSILATMIVAFGAAVTAEAQTLHIVNAASYSANSVAPGSIVTIFGSNMTNATATVTDPAHPPLSLAGTTVQIGAASAGLFFVSREQINAVIPATAAAGTQTVTVTSPTGTTTGTVVISASSEPGLFSLTGTGTNDGAIIQSLTGRVGAFSVTDGTRATFISLFLTGADLSTTPIVTVAGVSANVTFAGASPCCAGLEQINITLPASLAGAGRVPVMVKAAGQLSNVVEVVLLPAKGQGEFNEDNDNETRSRELSFVASIPGTSLALVADENDDVIREIDVSAKTVVHTIAIAENAQPSAIAVNSAGTIAVVAERKGGKVAILNLTTLAVTAEVPVGAGPLAVTITGSQAVVVNGDGNSVTVVDLTASKVSATSPVGRGPRGVAIDSTGHAYVTNQNDGTISVIDLATAKVTNTMSVSATPGGTSRPAAIQIIPGTTTLAVVADPAVSADGQVLIVNLTNGATVAFSVNVAHTGGANDIAIAGTTAYIANQAGGSISVLPLTITGTVTGTVGSITLDQGVRSLAIDVKDNLLLVVNESTGRIALVNLTSGQVVGRINAAISEAGEGDEDSDNHSDHDKAPNLPQIKSISPFSSAAGTSLTLTIGGKNLTGASSITFVDQASISSASNWLGKGAEGVVTADAAFTVSNIQVNADGSQLTATVAIAANAAHGIRIVRVSTPNGNSTFTMDSKAMFTVQ